MQYYADYFCFANYLTQKNIVMGLKKLGLTGDVEYRNLFPNTKYGIHKNSISTAQQAPRSPESGASFEGGWGGHRPPRKKKKRKKERKKRKKRKKEEKRKKGTINKVKLLHIKCCFYQFFNSPVALKNQKNFGPPRKS